MIFIVIDEEEHYEIHPLSGSGSLKIKKVIIKEPPVPVISKPWLYISTRFFEYFEK
jgi:hypothetical protein